jgi:cytochrome c553
MNKLVLTTLIVLTLNSVVAIAAGDPAKGKAKSESCASCHGVDGNSTNPAWPKIAGQHPKYLLKELRDFKAGKRRNELMTPMVAGLNQQDMEDLVAYFASNPPRPGYAEEDQVHLGEKLYRGGNFESGFAACMSCHGPAGSGNPLGAVPVVSGQHSDYIASQLRAFRSGERANDPYGIMRDVARRMTDEEIEAVANYIEGLH